MTEKKPTVYRQKTLDRISSPEQLTDYAQYLTGAEEYDVPYGSLTM